jgi:3-keto-5-aminohexanoate cleavage enzyme
MSKLIITAALTGGFASKKEVPHLPTQPEEISQAAYECFNEGAAIAHLHARDKEDRNSGNPDLYREIHERIRLKCPIVIQDTTGGGPGLEIDDRVKVLDAHSEMASLNMGTLLRVKGWAKGSLLLNPPWEIERFAQEMLNRGIKPEMEVYNQSMYRDVGRVIEKGLLKKPYCLNIVLGMTYQGGIDATVENLYRMVESLPARYREDTSINVCAIGQAQLPLTTIAMAMGHNIRVGMEDNVYYSKGVLVRSNAELVARSVRIGKELGLAIASPDEAREILGIQRSGSDQEMRSPRGA